MNLTTVEVALPGSSNVTTENSEGAVTWRVAMITLITVPLSAITIVGNVLVIISFRVNPKLRTVSNYFLLSLAVADLILGAISMNLYTTYIVIGQWTLGNLSCDVWLAVDYVASNASVMNLLAISFDRYLSVTRPLTYQARRTPKRAVVLIALAWGVSFVLWAPAILFWQYIVGKRTVPEGQCFIQFLSQPVITFGTAIAAFYLPVCVMVALYWRIYRETERRTQQLAELMASQGGDTSVLSQRSCQQNFQSSSSNESVVEEAMLQAKNQPEQNGRTLCPSITHCTAAWWKKRGEQYVKPPSHAANSLPPTDTQCGHHGQDKVRNVAHIPLVQVENRLDSGSDSDIESDTYVGNYRSDSQRSHRRSSGPRGSCAGVETGASSSFTQTGAQKGRKPRSWSLIREKKAARTLSAILLAFIVTWTPYNIMVLVSTFCDHCVPERLWQLGYWLCYVNSTVNPLCYALCNKHFRVTFKALLLCRWKEHRKGNRWTQGS